jgi:hypothetical protein
MAQGTPRRFNGQLARRSTRSMRISVDRHDCAEPACQTELNHADEEFVGRLGNAARRGGSIVTHVEGKPAALQTPGSAGADWPPGRMLNVSRSIVGPVEGSRRTRP